MSRLIKLLIFTISVVASLISSQWLLLLPFTGDQLFAVTCLAILCVMPFIFGISRKLDVFEPIYILSLSFFVFYVIGALTVASGSDFDAWYLNLREMLGPAIWLAFVGLLGFYAGYYWSFVRKLRTIESTNAHKLTINREVAFFWSVVGLLMVFGLFAVWVVQSGFSLSSLLLVFSEEAFYGRLDGGNATLYFFFFQNSWLGLLLLCIAFADKITMRYGFVILLGLVCIFMFGSGSRTSFILFTGSTIVFWYLYRQKRPSVPIIVIGFVVALLAADVMLAERGRVTSDFSGNRLNTQVTSELTTRSTISGMMGAIYVYPRLKGFIGLDLFQPIATLWVPRVIWPEKYVAPAPIVEVRSVFPSITGVSGMLGNYYMAFDFYGVFFVFLIFGFVNGRIYQTYIKQPENNFMRAFLSIWLFFCFTVLQRGSPDYFIIRFVYIFGPLYLVYFLSVKRDTANTTFVRSLSEQQGSGG